MARFFFNMAFKLAYELLPWMHNTCFRVELRIEEIDKNEHDATPKQQLPAGSIMHPRTL